MSLEPLNDISVSLEEDTPVKNCINLETLSKELERQTKDTQKLQEDVEQATRQTLERMGHTFNSTEVPVNYTSSSRTLEASAEPVLQTVVNKVDVNITRCLNFPGKDVLEHAIAKYSQQVADLQKNLRQLQTKLFESETEKNCLVELRTKESRKQSKLMGQLQETLLELDSLKQSGEQKLMEAEDQAIAFRRRAKCLDEMLQDMFIRLSNYEKCSGKSNYLGCDGTFSPTEFLLGPAVEKALQDLEKDNCSLQDRLQQMENQLEDFEKEDQTKTECLLKEHQEKTEQLTSSHEQEMAVLTEKLRSSNRNAERLHVQVEQLHAQVECETSLHHSQISNLESSLFILQSELLEKLQTFEAKVKTLEEALTRANSLAEQFQRERDLSIQQAEDLDSQLCRLTELSTEETKQLQAVLDKQEAEMHFQEQEAQKTQKKLDEAQNKVEAMMAEVEMLRLKLQDGEKNTELMRKPLETLQEERNCLAKQLKQLRFKNHQLKCALKEPEGRLCSVAVKEIQQQAALSEKNCCINQLKLKGLQVALGMQKQITAKREQIDHLQSHVQMLEETTDKLTQEKRYLVMKSKRHLQELHFEKEIRKRLETELDTLRTNEKLLKSKVEEMHAALHKMSDSFAECQEFIQKQEQEIIRLKLQHALELKELQGQNMRAISNIHRSHPISSPTMPEQLPNFQNNSTSHTEVNIGCQRPSPTLQLRSTLTELYSAISESQGPDTSLATRMRSDESYRKKKATNEQGPLQRTDLDKLDVSCAYSADNEEPGFTAARPCYRPSSCMTALGRRSPVHSLLISDVPDILKTESPTFQSPAANNQNEVRRQTCEELQNKLDSLQNLVEDLQIKNQDMVCMIKSQEKRMKGFRKTRGPLNT
ncbi:coiled-coil domain-containing protein 158-like isoform X2 [Hoplias malabaricus]|uniref:coiled-coil domain-containing protein 158-like isoform X2 n=1 Tax=Hoplias malabaricus TaxID=27720 RepID=UPI003461C742